MTLKELFSKVKFADIADELIKFDKRSGECLWLYKQAFDRMRVLPVGKDDGKVIGVKGWSVWSPSRDIWQNELAREVKAAKSATLKKVAAAILWELTYYSFDYDEPAEWARKDFQTKFEYNREYEECELDENPYRREWVELWQENHDLNCVYPEDIGTRTFSCKSAHDFEKPKLFPERGERRKEVEKRLEEVERKMRRYDLVTELTEQCEFDSETTVRLIDKLMNASPFMVDTIKAVCLPDETAEYLSDVILRWFPAQKGSESLVIVQCPANVDVNDICETIWAAFGSFRKLPNPKYLIAPNRNVREVILKVITFE